MCKSFLKAFNKLKQPAIFSLFIFASLVIVGSSYGDNNFSGSNAKEITERKKGTVIFRKGMNAPEPGGMAISGNSIDEAYSAEAKSYRAQGLQAQERGDLSLALKFYQKAVELDPNYAVAYNDLGIVYETGGDTSRAEESYLQSIKLQPDYLSPYSNLALVYENKRDFKTAAFYWKKRAELGSSSDPWTNKAKARYEAIHLTHGESSINTREQDIISLTREASLKKSLLKKDNKELSKDYFEKAKADFQKGNDLEARKEALNASQLDPANDEINEFIEKLQKRLLSR